MTEAYIPRPEYPRPQLTRDEWLNLNGIWDFQYDPEGRGECLEWHVTGRLDRTILVPFVHQSVLSGIGDPTQVDTVWYSRQFRIPDSWHGRRIVLNFGAVDYEAAVWINGEQIGQHRGGFTSFSFDITHACRYDTDNLLVVRAWDPISPEIPSGKQSHKEPFGCYYTRSTGIWQTVWLEPVGQASIGHPCIRTSLSESMVRISVPIEGTIRDGWLQTSISFGGKEISTHKADVVDGKAQLDILMLSPEVWDAGSPHLYDLHFKLFDGHTEVDSARSYFGMRDIEVSNGILLLNGKPFISRGILDQGIWPDGLYTAPSDDELRRDIERSMQLGFNSARLHQKVFEERSLYWADVLGYPVWAEFPDWGCDLRLPGARENVMREWREAVTRDLSHPSIIIWTPFNERQNDSYYEDKDQHDFVRAVIRATRELDPTRPVCSSSGFGHVSETDIADPHDYDHDAQALYERFRHGNWQDPLPMAGHGLPAFAQGEHYSGQPVIISEMGGMSWVRSDKVSDGGWGYGESPESMDEFINSYRSLIKALLDCEHLQGFVYTQLTDVEQEVNGLYYADRKPKFDPEVIREINTYQP